MNINENPVLSKAVEPDNDLKNWLVEYVGESKNPSDGLVTVELIAEVLAEEFPEFLLAIAEENWIRGYHQALEDVDIGKNMVEQDDKQRKSCKLCEDPK